jgi:hypothetical protein
MMCGIFLYAYTYSLVMSFTKLCCLYMMHTRCVFFLQGSSPLGVDSLPFMFCPAHSIFPSLSALMGTSRGFSFSALSLCSHLVVV